MPDWLRSLLIATLKHEQKRTIRIAFQDLLVTAVQGSVGRLQLEIAQKHHTVVPKLADAILHLLSRRVTKGSPLRDYLFLSFMKGQPKLAIEVPDTFSLETSKLQSWLKTISTAKYVITSHLILKLLLGLVALTVTYRIVNIFSGSCPINEKIFGLCTETLSEVKNVPSGNFYYGGSTSFAPLRSTYVIAAINKAHPSFKLEYVHPNNEDPGSGTGIEMLLNKQLDFAQSSRPLSLIEKQHAMDQKAVATDGIAIYVNSQLPIEGLTLPQVQKIFTGEISNWKDVGGPNLAITVFSRSSNSGTVEFVKQFVFKGKNFGPVTEVTNTTPGFLTNR